jgi:dipeptidyl aminopeptidase/acylaminoacyl peptidase
MNPLTAEVLWSLDRVGPPTVAGSTIVVPVTSYDVEDNKGTTVLHRVDPDGLTPLTSSTVSSTNPSLSPNGSQLAFLREVDKQSQLHLMSMGGGESRVLTGLPLGAGTAKWLADSSGLLFVAQLLKDAPTASGTTDLLKERSGSRMSARVTEERIYRFWDTWMTDGASHHIFHLDLASEELTDLTPNSNYLMAFPSTGGDPATFFDSDGETVYFSAIDNEDRSESIPARRLSSVAVAGGPISELTRNDLGNDSSPRLSPDGRTLYFLRTHERDSYATPPDVMSINVQTSEVSAITSGWELSPNEVSVDPESGDVFVTAEQRGRVLLFKVVVGQDPERIATDHTLSNPAPNGLGGVVMLRQSLNTPPEVVRVEPDGNIQTLTAVNEALLKTIDFGDIEETYITGARGDRVQMYVVHPPGPRQDKRPLVHMIHGGPHGAFGDTWHFRWNAHAFAAPGYVVALVNFHGSTGFGHEFTQCIQGAWGELPTIDIEAATDSLIANSVVDPERMAITGGSYGGYMVSWLGGQTDRYRAIVAHAAVTNQASMIATDITYGLARARGAEVWEDPDAVYRWSPSHHYANYVTPTLVIHGEKDYRVPINQGLELYGVLKAKGVDARLVYFPDENHWILKPQNSLYWYEEVLGWLNRYLEE